MFSEYVKFTSFLPLENKEELGYIHQALLYY